MADASAASGDLAALFRSGTAVGLTDGELLRRAARATGGDAEAFFAAIVERHGPMVLRVCRGALGNGPDADDAFQATFLVLARRLRQADRLESVGGWLFGVASRVTARARVDVARRDRLDRLAARLAVVSADPTDADRDRAVREEVGRLPSRYREVVFLCFWEGLTQEQAADRLGRPIGTVRSRSARARDLLRRRLAARGLAPDDFPTPSPTVPPALALAAARGAAELAAGRPTLALVGAHALELSRHVAGRMLMARLVPIAAVATITLAAGLSLGLGFGLGKGWWSPPPRKVIKYESPPDARPRLKAEEGIGPTAPKIPLVRTTRSTLSEYVIEPSDMLLVEVLDALEGRPITGEHLVRPDGRISLGFYGEIEVAGLTIAEVKEKVVVHLARYLNDEVLGLYDIDPVTGGWLFIEPRDSDRVVVDIAAYNSKAIYALGAFNAPLRRPFTGSDTLLDIVTYAGGLADDADARNVMLVRENPRPGEPKSETIDVDAVMRGDEGTKNPQLWPGDRLIAKRLPDAPHEPAPVDLAPRLDRLEARLDSLLKLLSEREAKP